MSTPIRVQAIGECMVELVRESGQAAIGYSGDTYNTAVYLRRVATQLAVPAEIGFLTGVGDDPESRLMRHRWGAEEITDHAIVVPGAMPGLYLITTDARGERSFTYWRKDSAAARLFAGEAWVEHVAGDLVYLSGISLQLVPPAARDRLVSRLDELRRAGTRVAFDSNYRPAAWSSAAEARVSHEAILRVTDIALVTLDDEIALGGCDDPDSCLRRLRGLGVAEAVVKVGAEGAWIQHDGVVEHAATRPVSPVDTTAAGDSFNGGYLAARLAGREPLMAAQVGHAVAGEVVLHRGAILRAALMPELTQAQPRESWPRGPGSARGCAGP